MGKVTPKEYRAYREKYRRKRSDEQVIKRLESVFAMDWTVAEACRYAGISETTYYRRCEDEEFNWRMQAAQQVPFLKARRGLMKNIAREDIRAIDIFLKKRDPRYKDKAEVDVSATVEGIDIEIW